MRMSCYSHLVLFYSIEAEEATAIIFCYDWPMVYKKISTDDISDIGEPLLDAGTESALRNFLGIEISDLAKDIPVIRTGITAFRLTHNARNWLAEKRLRSFMLALLAEEKTMEEFEALTEIEKDFIRGLVIAHLDAFSDDRQSEALAFLVSAYLSKHINHNQLIGISAEIKNINPLILYFNNADTGIEYLNDESSSHITITGLLTLPPAFGNISSTNYEFDNNPSEFLFLLNSFGHIFIKYIYEPMKLTHSN